MDVNEIMKIIKARRETFFDAQIVGTAKDPLVATAADVARSISDEYDSLLAEIEARRAA